MALTELAADVVLAIGGKDPRPRTAAIVVSAGNSTRMGGTVSKQFLEVGGVPVLARTLLTMERSPYINEIVVVARKEDTEAVWQLAHRYSIRKLTTVTTGGDTRAASVERGFRKIHPQTKFVAIHDGARCLITPEQVGKVCRAAYRHRAATAATAVTDTVKIVNRWGYITETVDRRKVLLVQTPQVFHADLYRAALANVRDDSLTDDNQLMEKLGHPVKPVLVGSDNIKITTPDDLPRAEWILSKREETP